MKYFLLHIIILFYFQTFGQKIDFSNKSEFKQIVDFEQKNAREKIGFKSNNNTANYDLKYHRLNWVVDPEKSFIEGNVTSYFKAKEALDTIVFDLSDKYGILGDSKRCRS